MVVVGFCPSCKQCQNSISREKKKEKCVRFVYKAARRPPLAKHHRRGGRGSGWPSGKDTTRRCLVKSRYRSFPLNPTQPERQRKSA
jgi:hypothetical protein